MQKRNATVAVIGAGDFIGGEIAKKFASEGFTIFAGRRNGAKLEPLVKEIEAAGGEVHARSLDARKEEEITAFLNDADKHAPLEVCIFNIGANVNFPILETTERVFRKVWEMACYSGFLAGREAARLMLPRGQGNIFFTGATASLRGGSGFAAFASAKFGLRAVAQAMARELGPKNIHVAHLIIDSGVDTEWVRQRRIEALGPECARQSRSSDAAGLGRGVLLAALSAAAERLDVRIGNQRRLARSGREHVRWSSRFPRRMRLFATKCVPSSRRIIRAEMRVPNPETDLTKEQMLLWHRILHKKGWIAPLWPKEYGGPGWSITRRFIFEQETTRAGTMPPLAFSVTMVGPVIYTFGNEAQKKKFLPRSSPARTGGARAIPSRARAPTSPPSAPRRCATATTTSSTATRPGPRWRSMPTGSSAWSAPILCQAAVRHFVPADRHEVAGRHRAPDHHHRWLHEVNDVFLEDVRVPVENLIGEENKGWTYAKFLLGNERTSMAGIGRSTRYLERLKQDREG